jgi:flagellar hook protein FlgE
MSFQQGLSGLNSSSKALDVISNNIANANTVGFKSAEVHFSDVFAASLGGGGASQVGIGAALSAVQQQFSQGNITTSNNPLDVSINGGGFYRMESSGGDVTFSRAGQFHLDNLGNVINDQTLRLTGVLAINGVIPPAGDPSPLQISSAPIPPRATDAAASGIMAGTVNLNSSDAVPAVAFTGTAIAPDQYNFSTALSVFDSLGSAHTLTMYFVRTATAGTWDVHMALDDSAVPANVQLNVGQLVFDTDGLLTPVAPAASVPIVIPATWALTTGAATPWSPGSIDFAGSTQYGSESSVAKLTQGGFASGALTGVSVGSNGVIQGNYTNGQSRDMAQIVLATFANSNGLKSLGNNQWSSSPDSGDALIGTPGAGSRGVLQSAAVEESNVDLTAELVRMITQQRNYQSNAQSIKTQDQILQTLVNLR